MGAVGLGFGGFMAGLALGGAGVQLLGGAAGVKDLLVNLAEGLNAFEVSSLTALGTMLGAGMLFGAVGGPKAAVGGGIGIGAVGAGLGAFLGALALSGTAVKKLGGSDGIRDLLINLAAGLNPLSQIDGTNLMKVGGGVLALTTGLAALGVGTVIKAVKEFFFGESDPKKAPLYQLAEQLKLFKDIDGENLSKTGQGFKDLASGLQVLGTMTEKEVTQAAKNAGTASRIAKESSSGSAPGSSNRPTPPMESSPPSGSGDQITFNSLSKERQDAVLQAQRKAEGFHPGSLTYDLNNPGAILYSERAKAFGGVPDNTGRGVGDLKGKFAKFPTLKDGEEAHRDLFSRKYGTMPIRDVVKIWTGNEQGKSSGYADQLMAAATGMPMSPSSAAPPKATGAVIAQASTNMDEGRRNTSSGGNNNPTTNNINMGSGNGSQTTASIANPYDTELARILTQGISA